MQNGPVQVFEINTNPTILEGHHHTGYRAPVHARFAETYREALGALGQ